jgi:hypothetical protein
METIEFTKQDIIGFKEMNEKDIIFWKGFIKRNTEFIVYLEKDLLELQARAENALRWGKMEIHERIVRQFIPTNRDCIKSMQKSIAECHDLIARSTIWIEGYCIRKLGNVSENHFFKK